MFNDLKLTLQNIFMSLIHYSYVVIAEMLAVETSKLVFGTASDKNILQYCVIELL